MWSALFRSSFKGVALRIVLYLRCWVRVCMYLQYVRTVPQCYDFRGVFSLFLVVSFFLSGLLGRWVLSAAVVTPLRRSEGKTVEM